MRIIETARKRILNGNVTNPFVLDLNGVTIRLKTDQGFGAGSVGLADFDSSGKIYTAVDNTLFNALDPLIDDYTTVCTTLVTDMSSTFSNVSFNQNITHFDTSNVVIMTTMFDNNNTFNQPIGVWDVSKVTDFRFMFEDTIVFNQPLNNWSLDSALTIAFMFRRSNYTQTLNNWNTSNITDMRSLFNTTNYNQPLNNWDVSSVTLMEDMFNDNFDFNQDLTSWCVELIPSEPTDFAEATFLPANRPNWGVAC